MSGGAAGGRHHRRRARAGRRSQHDRPAPAPASLNSPCQQAPGPASHPAGRAPRCAPTCAWGCWAPSAWRRAPLATHPTRPPCAPPAGKGAQRGTGPGSTPQPQAPRRRLHAASGGGGGGSRGLNVAAAGGPSTHGAAESRPPTGTRAHSTGVSLSLRRAPPRPQGCASRQRPTVTALHQVCGVHH